MNFIFPVIINLFLAFFCMLIMRKYMKVFFMSGKKNRVQYFVWLIYYFMELFFKTKAVFPSQVVLLINIILVFFLCTTACYGSLKKRCIFSVLICTVWTLVEIIIGAILVLFSMHGIGAEIGGSILSEIFMFMIAVIASHYNRQKNSLDISLRYFITLLLIPVVSIYLIHNIVLIAENHKKYMVFAIVASILLLLINYVVFEVYDWMTQNAETQERNLLYERQLELCSQQAEERETVNLEIRKMRHDMKDHLVTLLGMIQENEWKNAREYIQNLLKDSTDYLYENVSRSGNIVIDSLINYKNALAKRENIVFRANIFLPCCVPFQAGHLTTIFGNLLENALDACREIKEGERYIDLNVSYAKEVLMITVCNPYEGKRRQDREGNYLTTKGDTENHGLGISCVEQAVKQYHGQILIECREKVFQVTIVMYGHDE